MMSRSDSLRATLALLQPRLPRLLLAITLGALSLGNDAFAAGTCLPAIALWWD